MPAVPAPMVEPDADTRLQPGLVGPAMPLLQLMARLRSMASQPDPAVLRQGADAALAQFEARAAVLPELARRAHYALCAGLDDLVSNTPWGSAGPWAQQTLVGAHHPAVGPDRFFALLRQAEAKAAESLPLLELMHAVLSLGYLGPLRHEADGPAQAEAIRQQAFACIQVHAPTAPGELAAEWRGVAAPFSPRHTIVPLWVAASAGLAIAAGLYLFVSNRVNDGSDQVFAASVAAAPASMPQIARDAPVVPPAAAPASGEATALDRMRQRLRPLAATGVVSVAGTADAPIVRIEGGRLFAAGSGTLLPAGSALLGDLGAALRAEPGRFAVIGYTDDRPYRSVKFPSSFQLSAAQAQAVRDGLADAAGPASRWSAEGRAGGNPVASNATAEGRQQNHRVDIVQERPS